MQMPSLLLPFAYILAVVFAQGGGKCVRHRVVYLWLLQCPVHLSSCVHQCMLSSTQQLFCHQCFFDLLRHLLHLSKQVLHCPAVNAADKTESPCATLKTLLPPAQLFMDNAVESDILTISFKFWSWDRQSWARSRVSVTFSAALF
jgi:hypothetical protein